MYIWVLCTYLHFRLNTLSRLVGIVFVYSINWSHHTSDEIQSIQPNITHNHITFQIRCNQPNITDIHIYILKCMNSDHTLFYIYILFKIRVPNVPFKYHNVIKFCVFASWANSILGFSSTWTRLTLGQDHIYLSSFWGDFNKMIEFWDPFKEISTFQTV